MPLAAAVSFPLLSNLVGLPNQQAKGLGRIDLSAASDCIVSPIFVRTGTGTGANRVNPMGRIGLFLVTAAEIVTPSHFTDGIDPDATTNQGALFGAATQSQMVQVIEGGPNAQLASNTVYCFGGFSMRAVLQFRPAFGSLVVWNVSGDALSTNAASFYGKFSIET